MDEFTKRRLDKVKNQFILRVCRYRSLKESSAPGLIIDEEARLVCKALTEIIKIPELGATFLMDVMMNYDKLFLKFTQDRISPPLGDEE